jgi:drug/metabolite transporter (DMT)-like permease
VNTAEKPARVVAVLAFAVLVIAGSSILVRIAQADGVPSIAIAAWRVLLGTALLLPWVMAGHTTCVRQLVTKHGIGIGIAGAALAAHFAFWIVSLESLSVAVSTLLLATNPLWAALLSLLWLRERPSRPLMLGLAVSMAGVAWLFASGHAASDTTGGFNVLGAFFALGSALTFAVYLVNSRRVRARFDWVPYLFVVGVVTSAVLWGVVIAMDIRWTGWGHAAWLAVVAMAIGPHLIGHGAMNWSVRHLPATVVAVAALGEPLGAALLAWLVFGESVSIHEACAFGLIGLGIALALWQVQANGNSAMPRI